LGALLVNASTEKSLELRFLHQSIRTSQWTHFSFGHCGESYDSLRYVYERYINRASLRNAISQVVNATFEVRQPHIWGEGSMACAADARKFGTWGENLKTEWHTRYGGRGVMIYWHVERGSTAIYSQLKSPSSSEVASMIEGLVRHSTRM